MHTRHPSATSSRALASPCPLLEPVTMATLSVSPRSMKQLPAASFQLSAFDAELKFRAPLCCLLPSTSCLLPPASVLPPRQVVQRPVELAEFHAELVLLHELFFERQQVRGHEGDDCAL